ncbi:MAG: type II toxin-antitoxin system HicA family toxin [Coriobacteriales bacterium]|jgi:hypothetical protein|nr:type II toxin-antitoxin system HicA family toxin [Coriobacteriales bacterium]
MPSWKDLERFLLHDGWQYRPNNSGRDKSYTRMLDNGEVLWTRVSRSSGEIGKGLFAAILKQQLQVSRDYFNRVLADNKNSSNRKSDRQV